ncbi:hypothetical protein [Arthrobacter alpinus]|uniref:hypothetical protein n=1 Tax=Arthrobacter alpinus TaxID=656366 RepID=UPI001114BDA6|nr:hypothetical protein [Arthrobacter alpinus]
MLNEQGTHLHASVNGWQYPMSMDTMFAGALYVTVQNAVLGEGETPITMPWPWDVPEAPQEVTADELAAAKTTLNANSAFGQVRPQ